MNKLLTILALFMIVMFNACEIEKTEEPGEIPGMGNAEGDLEISEAFDLPEGIELVGSLSGFDESTSTASKDEFVLKSNSATTTTYGNYGCGSRWVKLKCQLRNNTDDNRTVFFP